MAIFYFQEVIFITLKQIESLIKLRSAGRSYTEIAVTLAIPKNTVKSYCSRNGIALGRSDVVDPNRCRQCGSRLEQTAKRKPRRFCSDTCRQDWWNCHRELVEKRSALKIVCAKCGTTFWGYPQEKRKYCSHACYINDRFGGDTVDDIRTVQT